MDSLFGSEKETTEVRGADPIQGLNQLKLSLATQLAGGDISPFMRGYLDKVLIPSTMNTAVAMGLGRSGAATEAVSQAVFGQGLDFLKALLSGVPAGVQPSTTRKTKEPGIFDWISLAKPVGETLGWMDKLFGGTETTPEIP